jgi:hypothetical protein
VPLRPRRVTLLRDLTGTNYRVPAGTPGLTLGIRTHFDLAHATQHGQWSVHMTGLPVFELLEPGTDVADHGEWDGTQGDFSDAGWEIMPILGFRKD